MAPNDMKVSSERVIDAPAEKIFDVLADPLKHPVIDGSGSVKRVLRGPKRLGLGSKFGMAMRLGMPYRIRNQVVEFEEGRRIGWCHFAKNVWRYELEPVDGGTRVRETFDWSHGRFGPFVRAIRFPERNQMSIEATLQRLDDYVTKGRIS
jgi:uncharacterized protein YndB with AHSA1/START domain